ncbi:hypothetical protein LZZ90_13620 [Flavobacterium sp. SM15]|uniref:hypothetical protein n=1 Tax=Flavobacterium sp. SM15 TaxID=2908005 RepID=UPI001EDB93D0|nr:hypothetical protein [Flavobacterium sp. SM15]MCG2612549.1 hypothetical protein [Flavobacterium sp. SM15]
MDELDLLKKDWKKNENQFPKISEKEIYSMLHKKSSSIVKWIFIISVLEIILWSAISFFTTDDKSNKMLEIYHIKTILDVIMVINYGVIVFFIYLFYKNFRSIDATDNVKSLMKNILRTRKTVQYYIWYNLAIMAITFIIVLTGTIKYDNRFTQIAHQVSGSDKNLVFWIFLTGISLVFLVVFLVVFWLFYRLIYGFLLRRLHKNYEELKKIDL